MSARRVSGGTPALVVKGGDSVYAFEIAIDEDSLYWRTNGESLLMSTPKIGGASKHLSGQTGIGANARNRPRRDPRRAEDRRRARRDLSCDQ